MARKVLVTGGGGFLGSFVLEQLAARGYADVVSVRQKDFDLTREADVDRLYAQVRPAVVVHLAAEVGGIGANRSDAEETVGSLLADAAAGRIGRPARSRRR